MQVAERAEGLPEDVLDVLVRQRLAAVDNAVEVGVVQPRHQVDVAPAAAGEGRRGQHVQQLQNVGVAEHAEQPHLPQQPLGVRPVREWVEDLLDRDAASVAALRVGSASSSSSSSAAEGVVGGGDDTVCALADDVAHRVASVDLELDASHDRPHHAVGQRLLPPAVGAGPHRRRRPRAPPLARHAPQPHAAAERRLCRSAAAAAAAASSSSSAAAACSF
mmetsp:Transcript_34221/g.114201  ORF Transcript_34221/g.114201 Transcript_34221/m.114201 type:complete len:219 (-) Transcript_34221:6-662(-)